ncbi:hypothetical protein EXS70_04440 [Candidatus Peribacteria bacterium]|nr:hypothetical protein [Candidatus Peribacteria bacterium]
MSLELAEPPDLCHSDDSSESMTIEQVGEGLEQIKQGLQEGGPDISIARVLSYLKDVDLSFADSLSVEKLVCTYRLWFESMMKHL